MHKGKRAVKKKGSFFIIPNNNHPSHWQTEFVAVQ
jgi:hypothetical protein